MAPPATTLLERNLRLCTLDGIVATPIVYLLTPGNYVMAALLTGLYHLPPEIYGLIVSLPFWGNFAQAFIMPFVNQALPPKRVTLVSAALQALGWGVMAAALSFLPPADTASATRWFLVFFIFSAAVTAFTGVSWTSWVQEWVPARLRGKYFGSRNRLLQVTQIVFLLTVGWLLTTDLDPVRAWQWLLGGTVALRVASVWIQHRIQAGATGVERADSGLPWRAQLEILGRTPAFLWFVAYGAAWGFAANCFGPFNAVFMYEELGLSVQNVSLIVILAAVGGALSYPGWGKLADRFGNKPVMLYCMILWQVQNFLWCFLTPSNAWLLYGMWVFGGVMGAGFTLTLFNIQLKLIPPEAKTLAISVNLAVTSLVTALAPMLGGWALQHLLASGTPAITVYHRVFAFTPIAALAACWLLRRVAEPKASPLSNVVGAMRNIRTLSGVLGFGFLVDRFWVKPSNEP